jgi:hypothetical protein
MTIEQPRELPPFQPYATASEFLTDAQIDALLAEHASLVSEGKLASGNTNAQIRRSQVVMLATSRNTPGSTNGSWAQRTNAIGYSSV